MREAFDSAIHGITADFLRMISLSLEQLAKVRSGIQHGNLLGLRDSVKQLDLEIDQLEIELEAACLQAIARHQPVAGDLRYFLLILKSLTDIERMGDYAVHVAGDLEALATEPYAPHHVDVLPILRLLTHMLERLAYAFTEQDIQAVSDVRRLDIDVDALYEQLQRTSLTRILEDPRSLGSSLKLGRMARSLERFGDHATNVADRIQYWVTGQR